ncbi:glucose-6-phosphate isomerase, partial [Kappamyces sp. JEL0680]
MSSVTQSAAWKALQTHYETKGKSLSLTALFESNPNRFQDFSTIFASGGNEILLDFSKNLIEKETLELLLNLARDSK